MNEYQTIRPSPIAGFWYPGRPDVLAPEIDQFLNNVEEINIQGEIVGLMAPHAGYRYSGQTAAYAFKQVAGHQYDLVVVLSPFHSYQTATLLSSVHSAYQTPLGEIPVDHARLEALTEALSEDHIQLVRIRNDEEHSLEIELPFLQRTITNRFSILPLMIRSIQPDQAALLAKRINDVVGDRKTLVVASTDLSHFYTQTAAEKYDHFMLEKVSAFDPQAVYQAEIHRKGFACGLGAVLTAMYLSRFRGANSCEILHYSTSGSETGDFSSVVGYGSAAFIKKSQ